MKVEYLNAFVQAFCEIVQDLTDITFTKDKVNVNPYPIPTQQITMVTGITGFIKGQVLYSLSETTARTLVGKWLKNLPPEKIEAMLKSGITEMANMITGRST